MSEIKITPIADRVIVSPDEAPKEVGGVIVPDSAGERPQKGTIIAVGPGTERHKMQSKVGDRCLFSKFNYKEVILDDGRKVLSLREIDLFGIIKS